jgi:hypothetical protein
MLDGYHWTAFYATGTDYWVNTTGDNMTGNLTVGNVTIYAATSGANDGKIDCKTVDPVVEIGGKKYATYGWDGIGLRTVYEGNAKLENGTYRIDIAQQPEGSDLWLFYNVVAESTIVPFVTPQAETYLMAKMEGTVLVVKALSGDQNAKFSLRLSGKRIDMASPDYNVNIRTDNPRSHIIREQYDKNGGSK